MELTLEIPDDIEADNNFVLLVVAEDGESFCNQIYNDIEITRDEKVEIESVTFNPSIASPGRNMEVQIKVKNLGEEEEDVTIRIENSELKISKASEEFQLEAYVEDDTETVTLNIEIPESAEEKEYELKFTADYGEEQFILKSLTVEGEAVVNNVVASIGKMIKLGSTTEIVKPATLEGFKSFSLTQNQWLLIVDILLFIGVIIEVFVIKSLRSGYK